jgi:hypothetical protein
MDFAVPFALPSAVGSSYSCLFKALTTTPEGELLDLALASGHSLRTDSLP